LNRYVRTAKAKLLVFNKTPPFFEHICSKRAGFGGFPAMVPTLPPPPDSQAPRALPRAPLLRRPASATAAASAQTPRPPACRSK